MQRQEKFGNRRGPKAGAACADRTSLAIPPARCSRCGSIHPRRGGTAGKPARSMRVLLWVPPRILQAGDLKIVER